ncbi:hypothetical protein D3C80_939000 [compost metagenome]
MREDLADRDRLPRRRKPFEILRHRGVEIEFSGLDKLHRRDAGEGLADRIDAENRAFRYGFRGLEVGLAVGAGEDDFAVLHDRQLKPRNTAIGHLTLDQAFNRDGLVVRFCDLGCVGVCAVGETADDGDQAHCGRNLVQHSFGCPEFRGYRLRSWIGRYGA